MGLLSAGIVLFYIKDQKNQYTSKTIINTGVVSGYNIENHNSDNRIDRDYTRNELENLIILATAYESIEEFALRLLATYLLLNEPEPQWITPEGFNELKTLLEPYGDLKELTKSTASETIDHLRFLRDSSENYIINNLIYSDNPFFGIDHLQTIKVVRKGASDLLELSYTTIDPAICKNTLQILTNVFIEKYHKLKEGQSEDVLSYFEQATVESKKKLRQAEEQLLKFRVENNIINYYEQTRFLADKKEDLDEFLFKEMMQLEATKSSLEKIEEQLKNRGVLYELNNAVLEKRDELSKVNNKLALAEFSSEENKSDPSQISFLQNRLKALKKEVGDIAREKFKVNYTPDGLASEELLSNWLKAIILQEESQSRLGVIKDRKKEFESIYSKFAPWGSRLKKIEREIALAEDAYLENLHSYNQARLHMQNTLMLTNLKILDAPFYPTKASGSSTILLMVMGFIAGVLLTLGLIIVLEYMDETMKIPTEAESKTGLPLLGILPRFPDKKSRFSNPARLNFPLIRKRSLEMIYQKFIIRVSKIKQEPKIVMVSSALEGEGVSSFCSLMVDRLKKDYYKVLHLIPEEDSAISISALKNSDRFTYFIGSLNGRKYGPQAILDAIGGNVKVKDYDFIIIEIPAMMKAQFPLQMIQTADELILVCRSNRIWNTADKNLAKTLKSVLEKPPLLILNGVRPEAMEQFLGDLPKPRTKLKRMIKQFLIFNFSGKTNI
jgi:uncharacterized protein involved in exopolysaccharide biosynthesis